MGNTTNYLTIMLTINLLMGIMAIGLYAVNPTSQYLLGNYLFNNNQNALMQETETSNGIRTYNFSYSDTGLSGISGSASLDTDQNKQPDWIKASNNWLDNTINAAKSPVVILTSFVGAPYIFLMKANINQDLAALIGVFWGILGTLIFANWVFGRDT